MHDVIGVGAALLVLGAFVGAQMGRLTTHSAPYLWLNLIGTSVLAYLALLDRTWGFVLLEGVWAIVSAVALVRLLRGGGAQSGRENAVA